MMKNTILLGLFAVLLLTVSAGLARLIYAAPAPGPAAYLVYTGGLFGQLEPCG